MPTDPLAISLLTNLVRDVFNLREVIHQNHIDDQLKTGARGAPISFVYLVDTEVFGLYAEPAKWADQITPLPSLKDPALDRERNTVVGSDLSSMQRLSEAAADEMRQPVLEANALLTGEFIFSEALVGSSRSILISPEHVPEIMDYVSGLSSRFNARSRSRGGGEDPYTDVRHALGGVRALNEMNALRAQDILERARRIIVAGLSDVSHSDLLAAHRLGRVFQGNFLANAAGEREFSKEIAAPPVRTIEWWQDEIRRQKFFNNRQPTKRALEADAVTLAQLSLLNDDWQNTGKLYVLITDDRGLHRAYMSYCDTPRKPGEQGPFFAVRSTKQYIPILNIDDMGGAYRDSNIFREIDAAVSSFADTFYSTDIQDSRYFSTRYRTPTRTQVRNALTRHLDRYADETAPLIDDVIERLRAILVPWASALTYAVTAKADVIRELVAGEIDYLRRILRDPALKDAFEAEVRSLTEGIEGLTTSSTLLRYELRALEAASTYDASSGLDLHGRRDLPSEFGEFRTPTFRGRRLTVVVGDIERAGVDAPDVLSKVLREERLLVMGALCLDVGAWAAAASLLQHAETAARATKSVTPALMQEVRFLRCLARRLAADSHTWQAEYREVESVLKDLAAAPGSAFDAARIASEQLALQLCALAWVSREQPSATLYLEHSIAQLQEARRLFEPRGILAPGVDPPWGVIQTQILLNTMVLTFWSQAIRNEVSSQLAIFAGDVLAFLKSNGDLSPKEAQHGSIYPDLAGFALASNQENKFAIALRLIENIGQILQLDRDRGFAFDVPEVDKAEYVRIRQILSEFITARTDDLA